MCVRVRGSPSVWAHSARLTPCVRVREDKRKICDSCGLLPPPPHLLHVNSAPFERRCLKPEIHDAGYCSALATKDFGSPIIGFIKWWCYNSVTVKPQVSVGTFSRGFTADINRHNKASVTCSTDSLYFNPCVVWLPARNKRKPRPKSRPKIFIH